MSRESDEVSGNAAAFEWEEPPFGEISRLAVGGSGSDAEAQGRSSVGSFRRAEQAARALRSGYGQGLVRSGIRGRTVRRK